jgi:hypothetical protein
MADINVKEYLTSGAIITIIIISFLVISIVIINYSIESSNKAYLSDRKQPTTSIGQT